MSNNSTNIWSWITKDEERLREEGGIKQTLVEHYQRFWEYFRSDNLTAELAINDALDAARAAGEMSWELHLRHWRLQLWLTQDRIKEMLPEAIDLLSLAVDERVKDVPQRICAYHDIVECYVQMDPAGYYQDIKENSEHILGQLPKKHSCADCARGNIARAAAAAGHTEEAQRWLAEHEANTQDAPYPGMLLGRARTRAWLKQWEEAERIYQEASKIALREEAYPSYIEALIGVARAQIGKGNLAGAAETILQVRRNIQYEGETNLLAFLLEVEGYLAESHNVPQAASGYLTHSARLQYELGRYRDAAELALHSLEMSDKAGVPVANREETLTIAANAVGMLPTSSEDLYQRLAVLGRAPATQKPGQEEEQTTPISTEQRRETESNTETTGED
jgi:tetratricopeptide (TPR) repeat protein